MIGMFAISGNHRNVAAMDQPGTGADKTAMFHRHVGDDEEVPRQILRGSTLGTAIGRCPATVPTSPPESYAMSKKFSRNRRNSAPDTSRESSKRAFQQFGARGAPGPGSGIRIPGDSITAIVIGVLYIKA